MSFHWSIALFLSVSPIPAQIWLLSLWSPLSVTWRPLSRPHITSPRIHVSNIRVIRKPLTPDQDEPSSASQRTPQWGRGQDLLWGENSRFFKLRRYDEIYKDSVFKGYHGILHAGCWTADWQQSGPSWLSERAKVDYECVWGPSRPLSSIPFKPVYKIEYVTFIGFISIKLFIW